MALLTEKTWLVSVAMALTLGVTTACYEPAVRDCVVSCSAADECAADQQCAGGWCTSPGTACTGGDGDAGNGDDVDARPSIDAPGSAMLRIEVKEYGRVTTDQSGVDCDGPNGDCLFSITSGIEVTLTAVENNPNYRFEKWTQECDGEQSLTCNVTVDAPMTRVGVEFKRDDD